MTFEHAQKFECGYAISQPVLEQMSREGWELVAVNSQANQWQTYCVSYWKRPTVAALQVAG